MLCYIFFIIIIFFYVVLYYFLLFYYTILVRNALFSKSPKIKHGICTYTHEARTVLCHAHTITSAKMMFPTTCKTQLP